MTRFVGVATESFSSVPGDPTSQLNNRRMAFTRINLGESVDEDLCDELIVPLRERQGDFHVRWGVAFGGATNAAARPVGHLVVRSQQPSVDQLVEVEGRELHRDTKDAGSIFPGDWAAPTANEAVKVPSHLVT